MTWVRAAARSALAARGVIGVDVAGRRVALYRLDGGVFATSDICPHAGLPLSAGCIVEGHIECPGHRALFDIRTGAADGSVTARALATFPVKIEDDEIFVDLPAVEETMR